MKVDFLCTVNIIQHKTKPSLPMNWLNQTIQQGGLLSLCPDESTVFIHVINQPGRVVQSVARLHQRSDNPGSISACSKTAVNGKSMCTWYVLAA